MTHPVSLPCVTDSEDCVQKKKWKPDFQVAMTKAWRVDHVDISSSDGCIYIIKFRTLEWNTPQLLSRAVQQLGCVKEVKQDTSGRIRVEIDLQQSQLLRFAPLPLFSHPPLL